MRYHGEILAQLGDNCYEVVQVGVSWSHAESICKQQGGHLIHIANKQEQDFILNFLAKHHSHTVWIGLHDQNQEENFEWSSGKGAYNDGCGNSMRLVNKFEYNMEVY